ncbi:MAG TPA: TonB-dependent receptor [Vicinamibacterales bacterium]|nr:TonB-dependent receptor [Vicinamibacterales bacterium]
MAYLRAGAALLVLLWAWPGAAIAQVSTTGTIQVIVEDSGGGRLPGVTVTARAADTITTRTAVTNEEGVATLDAMAPSANYQITATLAGFQEQTLTNVLVRSGQTASARFTLSVAGVTEQVTVLAESPLVDTTKATTGQDITLQLTESLPTGRSYQSYLQLAPGVMPDDPTAQGNPAARGGINYSDIGGNLGVSTDNAYYFDGINVTDPLTGTFGANLNTEIIQEQKVVTGGIPAEFVGTPGLIANVITKSGSNRFSGSVNYFFQNTNLMADNKNGPSDEFETIDNGYTFGGPIWRDKAWFFGSYRYLDRKDDVSTLDTHEFLRKVENKQHQGFAKGSWGFTSSDMVSFTFLNDPTDISGRRDRDITNARDRATEQGGNRYAGLYTRVWGGALLEVGGTRHNGEVSVFSAIRESSNEAIFQRTDPRTLADQQLGGFGQDQINERDTESIRGSLSYNWGRHTFKGGAEYSKNTNFRNTLYIGDAIYWSLASKYAGARTNASQFAAGSWTNSRWNVTNASDFGGLLRTIDASPERAHYYNVMDLNHDGTITQAEAGQAILWSSTAGNPHGIVNYARTLQSAKGPQETYSKGLSFFVQDAFTFDRLTVNVGMRTERWEHFATNGNSVFVFDWEFAPRLSAVYDLRGDGRQKLSGYWGRYYDPVRNNMTNFAGTLTGSVLDEQVWVADRWTTFRTRGGPVVLDAVFSPTTQTPYTDDLTIGYAVDLGQNMAFEALFFNRRARDILEDYDASLYAYDTHGETVYPGPIDHPDSLWLGPEYFGYTAVPAANFLLGTLEGGKRDAHGIELVFRKRFADRWQMLASYNWTDAEGNTNSDSNADFQGDVIELDPRAPNQLARQPGNIEHLVKMAGSYTFDIGVQVGAVYSWNSGTWASRTYQAYGRNLPMLVEAGQEFEFAGIDYRWLAPDAVGSLTNPSYGTLDLRAQYNRTWTHNITTEFFVDLFNVTDNQGAIRNQDLVAGAGGKAFGEGIAWITPRRAFVGARLRF